MECASRVNKDDAFRISIAGAQEKTALLWLNNQWHLPHGSTPTLSRWRFALGIPGLLVIEASGAQHSCSLDKGHCWPFLAREESHMPSRPSSLNWFMVT